MEIKEIRALTKLSQRKFAEKYGMQCRTIERWENGDTTPPVYVKKMLERVVKEDVTGKLIKDITD